MPLDTENINKQEIFTYIDQAKKKQRTIKDLEKLRSFFIDTLSDVKLLVHVCDTRKK